MPPPPRLNLRDFAGDHLLAMATLLSFSMYETLTDVLSVLGVSECVCVCGWGGGGGEGGSLYKCG